MKTKEEIIKRALTLLLLADRSALEEEIIDGVRHSLLERENQRLLMLDWLQRHKYYDYLTRDERRIFETRVTEKVNVDILRTQINHECIEPLLWSIGFVDELSDYDGYVTEDFHPLFHIGGHSFQSLVDDAMMKSYPEMLNKCELAMLWYWRCLEHRRGKMIDCQSGMVKCFGKNSVNVLLGYSGFDMFDNDFVVRGKPISSLSNGECALLEVLAERRLLAFEWILSDEDWEHVSLIA